jgi:hypothetical protein
LALTEGTIEGSSHNQDVAKATWAGAGLHLLTGGIQPKAISILAFLILGWFSFCAWIFKNDNELGRLNGWEGYKQYLIKVVVISTLALVALLFFFVIYFSSKVISLLREKFSPTSAQ